MMRNKGGRGNSEHERLMAEDRNDDALLHIEPVLTLPVPAPPYSTNIQMQPTTTVRVNSASGQVYVTAQPLVRGSGSVFVLSQPIKPDPHCCLSFFSIILCPLFGCVACLFTCSTKCENDRNDIEMAKCRSSCACGWATVGIVCGLIALVALAAMAISGLWIFAHASTSPVVVQALSDAIGESVRESNRDVLMANYGKSAN